MPEPHNEDPFGDIVSRIDFKKLKPSYLGWGIAVLAVAIGLSSSIYTVQPEGKAVLKRFGKVIAIKKPGLHFKLPFGIDREYFVPTERILKEEFGFRTVKAGRRTRYSSAEYSDESLMLTGDLNVINVEWVVQFRIDDPDKFMHQVEDQISSIRDVSEAVMRRIVGNRLGSDVLTVGRVEIAEDSKNEIQRILNTYDMGVHITSLQLQDVTPPEKVKPAFNKVNESRQEKERLINNAEKMRNQKIPRAKGEADQIVSEAEGYAAERINIAKGEASRFKAIQKEYSQNPEVTRQRLYIETMDKVISEIEKLYVIEEGGTTPIPLLNLDDGGVGPLQKGAK